MKKLYTTLFVLCFTAALSAQCVMQVSCNWVTCFGDCDGSATAYVVNATPPYTYQWMPGNQTTQTITGLCAGTYTCIMIDSLGCTATAQCTVGSPQPLQAMITSVIPPSCPSCCDGSATGTANGGTPPYTFMWSPPPTPSATMNGMCVGTYTFCVVDANGCQSCTTIVQQVPQVVPDNSNIQSLIVSPNASGAHFSLTCSFSNPESGELIVTNMLGEVIVRSAFGTTDLLQTEIDLSGQAGGLYFISVVTASGITTRRISHN